MPKTMTRDHRRDETLRIASVQSEGRTVTATIATERKVAIFDYGSRTTIDEILLVRGCDHPDQVPLLSEHRRELSAALGSVRSISVDGDRITASLHFGESAAADEVWPLVRDRHVIDVSVGYGIDQAETIPAGQSRTIAGRKFTAGVRPLRVVTAWRLREASLVVIGADDAAKIRSLPNLDTRSQTTMPRETSNPRTNLCNLVRDTITGTAGSVRMPDVIRVALRHLGEPLPENDAEVLRAGFSNPDIGDAIDSAFNAALMRGYATAPDTTRGLSRDVDMPNFRPAELFTLSEATRLDRVPRGGSAEQASIGVDSTDWSIARYGKQLVATEEDLLSDRLGAITLAVEQLGIAARRVRSDLVFSLLLSNPTMSDGVSLFHSDHANYGTGGASELDATSLAAGLAAIAGQTLTDDENAPIHLGLSGRYLLVPPALVGTARTLARNLALGDGDLEVRAESRLSATGVVDPSSDEGITGTDTNWLLAAPAVDWPSIVVGGLQGPPTPRLRRFELDRGQWGVAWDINLDIGAAVVDHRALYFADGA